jgi:hypothetical protein
MCPAKQLGGRLSKQWDAGAAFRREAAAQLVPAISIEESGSG